MEIKHYSDALGSLVSLKIIHIMKLVRNKSDLWSWWSSVLAFFSLIVGGYVGCISFCITKLLNLLVALLLKIGEGITLCLLNYAMGCVEFGYHLPVNLRRFKWHQSRTLPTRAHFFGIPMVCKVTTRVALVPSCFLNIIWVIIMRISHFLLPVGYGYLMVFLFPIPFGFIYHPRSFMPR